jgi:hypothetical protein
MNLRQWTNIKLRFLQKSSFIFLLICFWMVFMFFCVNCAADQHIDQGEILHCRIYQDSQEYNSLLWLTKNYLIKGMNRQQVEKCLGVGQKVVFVHGQPAPIIYTSINGPNSGNILYLHYEKEILEDWEWASE